jgi:hypothetical protein
MFLPTLTFLCFFCFMLICQLAIGGQKGGEFCHHRIEVISISLTSLKYNIVYFICNMENLDIYS